MTNSPENTGDFERNRRSSAKRRSRAALAGRGGSLDRAIDVFGSTRSAGENPWELRALLRSFKTALGNIAARYLKRATVASAASRDSRPCFAAPWLKLVTALTFVAWRMLRVLRTHQRWERRAICYRLQELAEWRAAHGPLTSKRWSRLAFDLHSILTDTLRLRPSLHRLEGRFWRLWVIFTAVFAGPPAPCRKPPPSGLARAEGSAGMSRMRALLGRIAADTADELSQPAVKRRRRALQVPNPFPKPRAPRPKRPPRSLDELPHRHGPRWFHWPPTDWLASLARRGQIHEPATREEFEQLCERAFGPDAEQLTQAEVRSAENPAFRAPLGNPPTCHSEAPGGDEESGSGEASGVASEKPRSQIPRGGKNAGPRNDSVGTAAPSPDGKAAARKTRSARPRRPKSAPSAAVQSPDRPSPDHPIIQCHSEEPGGDEQSRSGMASGVASEEPRNDAFGDSDHPALRAPLLNEEGSSAGPRNDSVGTAAPSPDGKAAARKTRSTRPRRPKSAPSAAVQSPDRPSPDHPMIQCHSEKPGGDEQSRSGMASGVASEEPRNDAFGDSNHPALRAPLLNEEGSSAGPRNDSVGSAAPSPDGKAADRKTRSARPRRPKSAPSAAVQSPDHPSPDRPIAGSPNASSEPSPLVVAFADALYDRLTWIEGRREALLEMLLAVLEGCDSTPAPAGGEGNAAARKTPSLLPRRRNSTRPAPTVLATGDAQGRSTCDAQAFRVDGRPLLDSQTPEKGACASSSEVAAAAPDREQIEESLGFWMEQYHATLEQAAKNARLVQVHLFDLAASRCELDVHLLSLCRPPLTPAEVAERRGRPEWEESPVLADGTRYRCSDYFDTNLEPGSIYRMFFRDSHQAEDWFSDNWRELLAAEVAFELNYDDDVAGAEENDGAGVPGRGPTHGGIRAYEEFARKYRRF